MIKKCKECGNQFDTNINKREYCSRNCSNAVIARNREKNKLGDTMTTVWSCGGGVQSTGIAALIYMGKLPKPDYAIMTDCGYEKESTWDYVYGTLIPKLQEVGVTLNIIKTTDSSNNDIFDKSGHLLLPAFSYKDGRIIKFQTHCNSNWKVKPAQRWLREQGVKHCENWIGISTDESKRTHESGKKWFELRYPLIEQCMTREDCIYLIGSLGWPKPPRTSCFCCPQQDDAAWEAMRRNCPGDWRKAVEIDEYIRTVTPDVYLHRSMTPLRKRI